MGKLAEAEKALTYPAISSKILLELYGRGITRSSVLVNTTASELQCSPTLIYETLAELVKGGLVYSPTARKRLKFYALTEAGTTLVNEEILKKEIEIRGVRKQIPEPTKDSVLELLTEEILQELPNEFRTPSARMLLRRRLDRNVDDVKRIMLKSLKKKT